MFCAGRGGYYEYIAFDVDPDIKFTINSFSCFMGWTNSLLHHVFVWHSCGERARATSS